MTSHGADDDTTRTDDARRRRSIRPAGSGADHVTSLESSGDGPDQRPAHHALIRRHSFALSSISLARKQWTASARSDSSPSLACSRPMHSRTAAIGSCSPLLRHVPLDRSTDSSRVPGRSESPRQSGALLHFGDGVVGGRAAACNDELRSPKGPMGLSSSHRSFNRPPSRRDGLLAACWLTASCRRIETVSGSYRSLTTGALSHAGGATSPLVRSFIAGAVSCAGSAAACGRSTALDSARRAMRRTRVIIVQLSSSSASPWAAALSIKLVKTSRTRRPCLSLRASPTVPPR